MVDEEVLKLEAGDTVYAGGFMASLDTEDVEWTVLEPRTDKTEMVLQAEWLGVFLGKFRVDKYTGKPVRLVA